MRFFLKKAGNTEGDKNHDVKKRLLILIHKTIIPLGQFVRQVGQNEVSTYKKRIHLVSYDWIE